MALSPRTWSPSSGSPSRPHLTHNSASFPPLLSSQSSNPISPPAGAEQASPGHPLNTPLAASSSRTVASLKTSGQAVLALVLNRGFRGGGRDTLRLSLYGFSSSGRGGRRGIGGSVVGGAEGVVWKAAVCVCSLTTWISYFSQRGEEGVRHELGEGSRGHV